jgi:hypothetical protein
VVLCNALLPWAHAHLSPHFASINFCPHFAPKTSEKGNSGTSFFLAHAGSLAEANTELLLLRKDKY